MRVESVFSAIGQGVTNYGGCCGGGRAVDALAPVEMSGLLSGLKDHEVDFAYGLYRQDEAAQARFIRHFVGLTEKVADRERWNAGKVVIDRLSSMVAMSFFSPSVCYLCGGVGRSGIAVCMGCHGDGRAPFSVADKIRLVGVSKRQWYGFYAKCYANMHDYVASVDQRIRVCVSVNQLEF